MIKARYSKVIHKNYTGSAILNRQGVSIRQMLLLGAYGIIVQTAKNNNSKYVRKSSINNLKYTGYTRYSLVFLSYKLECRNGVPVSSESSSGCEPLKHYKDVHKDGCHMDCHTASQSWLIIQQQHFKRVTHNIYKQLQRLVTIQFQLF